MFSSPSLRLELNTELLSDTYFATVPKQKATRGQGSSSLMFYSISDGMVREKAPNVCVMLISEQQPGNLRKWQTKKAKEVQRLSNTVWPTVLNIAVIDDNNRHKEAVDNTATGYKHSSNIQQHKQHILLSVASTYQTYWLIKQDIRYY